MTLRAALFAGASLLSLSIANAQIIGPSGGAGSTAATPFAASGNGATNSASSASRFGETIDVVADFGAVGDAVQCSDATLSGSSLNQLNSTCATFTSSNVGEAITVAGVGPGGAPLVAAIASVTDTNDAVLTVGAAYASSSQRLYLVYPSTPQSGSGSYVPADVVTFAGATSAIAAQGTVFSTEVQSATVAAAGSGGTTSTGATSGACEVYGTTGTGDKARVNVTLTSGAVTAVNSVDFIGRYVANPTSIAVEPVTGCGSLSGAQLSLSMGVRDMVVTTQGVYSATASTLTQASTTGSGTGLIVNAGWASDQIFAYGHDNRQAFKNAQTQAASVVSNGVPVTIHIPPGYYYESGPLNTMTRGVSIVGDGDMRSVLVLPNSYSGSLLQFSNSWYDSVGPAQTGTINLKTAAFGLGLHNFGVQGDTTSPSEATVIDLRDWNDNGFISDITMMQVNGRCFSAGRTLNSASASFRESTVENIRTAECGAADVPGFEITAQGSGPDGSNEIQMNAISLFANRGRGFVISDQSAAGATRLINVFGLRVEGLASTVASPTMAGDLIVVGDAAAIGQTSNINLYGIHTASEGPYSAAVRVSSATSSVNPYQITLQGLAGTSGYSNSIGTSIDAGHNVTMNIVNESASLNFVIGPSPFTAPLITINADQSALQGWTNFVDPSAYNYVATPMMRYGTPQTSNYSLGGAYHNGTAAFGNAPGNNSVDFLSERTAATQGAIGAITTVVGGESSTASGIGSSIYGGNGNFLGGTRSFATGYDVNDHTDSGGSFYASGQVTTSGDTQISSFHLFGNGTGSTIRLVTEGGGAASGVNCINLPASYSYSGVLLLHATDTTTRGTDYSWSGHFMLTKDTNAASTAVAVSSTPDILSRGTITGASVSVTADTTNSCVNVTFTKPTASASDAYTVTGEITGAYAAQ